VEHRSIADRAEHDNATGIVELGLKTQEGCSSATTKERQRNYIVAYADQP
jgi:hypothetical protein